MIFYAPDHERALEQEQRDFWRQERADEQNARRLAEERQQRAVRILADLYRASRVSLLQSTTDDIRFLAAECGVDWQDVIRNR